jgi:hypothetical protein
MPSLKLPALMPALPPGPPTSVELVKREELFRTR